MTRVDWDELKKNRNKKRLPAFLSLLIALMFFSLIVSVGAKLFMLLSHSAGFFIFLFILAVLFLITGAAWLAYRILFRRRPRKN